MRRVGSVSRGWPLAVVMALAASLISGCSGGSSAPDLNQPIDTWFDIQKKYAEAWNRDIQATDEFRIAPITGAIFPAGAVLPANMQLGTDILNTDCTFPAADLVPTRMTPLPSFVIQQNAGVSLGVPGLIKKAFGFLVDAGVTVDDTTTVRIAFAEPQQLVLARDKMDAVVKKPKCVLAIGSRTVLLVRGYIKAKQITSSAKKLTIEAHAKDFVEDQLKVSWGNDGSFALEDTTPREWFAIISKVKLTLSPGEFRPAGDTTRPPRPASVTVSYEAPTDVDLSDWQFWMRCIETEPRCSSVFKS